MNQLLQTLTRCPEVIILLSPLAVSLMLMTGCDRAGQKGETGSWFSGARVDTVTVRDTITLRDTIVVEDTMLVEKKIILRDTMLVEKKIILRDTMLVEKKIILRDTMLVEKEVIKRVEVPAEIPAHYEEAWERQVAESTALIADEKTCFSGLNSMEVSVVMNEDAKDILSEQRAKDKFELTLRRYGVPLSNLSNPYLELRINALWNEDKIFATYVLGVELRESIIFYRNNKPHKHFVTLWEAISYGYVGKDVARESLLRYLEEKAERVANLYLSAN